MILIDSGALVAIVDRAQPHHAACVRVLKDLTEPLASIWLSIAEAMEALRGSPKGRDVVWEMIERGAIRLLPLEDGDVPSVRRLMMKADRPVSMAEAGLIHMATREGLRTVFTTRGKEMSLYRIQGRKLKVLP
jgi:predicted nucleic acid-binding protein